MPLYFINFEKFCCEIYKSYSTLSISDLHKYQLLLFVPKFIHHPKLLPEVFIIVFSTFNEETHSYNTRTLNDGHVWGPRMQSAKPTGSLQYSPLWRAVAAKKEASWREGKIKLGHGQMRRQGDPRMSAWEELDQAMCRTGPTNPTSMPVRSDT